MPRCCSQHLDALIFHLSTVLYCCSPGIPLEHRRASLVCRQSIASFQPQPQSSAICAIASVRVFLGLCVRIFLCPVSLWRNVKDSLRRVLYIHLSFPFFLSLSRASFLVSASTLSRISVAQGVKDSLRRVFIYISSKRPLPFFLCLALPGYLSRNFVASGVCLTSFVLFWIIFASTCLGPCIRSVLSHSSRYLSCRVVSCLRSHFRASIPLSLPINIHDIRICGYLSPIFHPSIHLPVHLRYRLFSLSRVPALSTCSILYSIYLLYISALYTHLCMTFRPIQVNYLVCTVPNAFLPTRSILPTSNFQPSV
jgi:hypothetical protein